MLKKFVNSTRVFRIPNQLKLKLRYSRMTELSAPKNPQLSGFSSSSDESDKSRQQTRPQLKKQRSQAVMSSNSN